MCRLEPTQPDSSGTRVAVTFRGTPPTVSVCDQNDPQKCTDKIKFRKYNTGTYCRNFGTGGAIMCRLDNVFLENLTKSSGTSTKIEFATQSGKIFKALGGIMLWSFQNPADTYSLILNPGVDTSLSDIEAMISEDPTEEWTIGLENASQAGGDVTAKNGVVNWVMHIQETGAYWLFFNADEVPGEPDIGSYVARKFPPGSTLEVLYDTGKPEEDNLALAHVYGKDFPDTQGLADGWPLLLVGNANEGFKPRDANVYNIVTTAAKNYQGGSHYYRQYFVMDRFSDISETAAGLVSEVIQQNYNVNDANDETPVGRTVKLYKKENKVGATIGDDTCGGNIVEPQTPSLLPYPLPTDRRGNTLILQSRANVRVSGISKRKKRCILNIRVRRGLSGRIHGGPSDEKLVFDFYTQDGVSTGEKLYVDGIRHWY